MIRSGAKSGYSRYIEIEFRNTITVGVDRRVFTVRYTILYRYIRRACERSVFMYTRRAFKKKKYAFSVHANIGFVR